MYTNYNRYTPKFDFNHGTVTISGKSVLEDPGEVWLGFIKELKDYINKYDFITVDFRLDAFNTSSSMYVTNVMLTLDELKDKCKVTINWYYLEIDEDMQFLGEAYKDMTKTKVNLIVK